jgi:fucose permease
MKPKTARIILAVGFCTAFIGLGMTTSITGPMLPSLAAQTGSTLDQISLILTAGSLGYLIAVVPGSGLLDRFRGEAIVGLSILGMALAAFLIPLMPGLWLLVAVLFLMGLFQGFVDAGENTLIVWLFGDKVGPWMNSLHFSFGLGGLISPVLAARVVQATGEIRWAYWILALALLPLALWILPFRVTQSPQKTAENGVSVPISVRQILPFGIMFFLYVGGEIGFSSFLYSYALEVGAADETAAAYLTSAFWLALTAGRLAGIPIAARARSGTILTVDLFGCLVSTSLILLWPGSTAVLWAATLGLGFSMASIFPTLIAHAERRMTITGRVMSVFFGSATGGGMLWPLAIGRLFVTAGPGSMPWLILIQAAVAFWVLIFFMKTSSPSRKAVGAG